EALLQFLAYIVEPSKIGPHAQFRTVDQQTNHKAVNRNATQFPPLRGQEMQLAGVRFALAVDQPKQLWHALGRSEEEFHGQFLAERPRHVSWRLKDEGIEVSSPSVGNPEQFAARARLAQHLFEQTFFGEAIEHTVHFSE